MTSIRWFVQTAGTGAILVITACEASEKIGGVSPDLSPAALAVPAGSTARVIVCKGASTGGSHAFSISRLTEGVTLPQGSSFALSSDECKTVATTTASRQRVLIDEAPNTGFSSVDLYRYSAATKTQVLDSTKTGTSEVNVRFGGDVGWVIVYHNQVVASVCATADGGYDAGLNTLPEAQGWTFFESTSNNPPPFVSNGLLVQDATNGGAQYWFVDEPAIDFSQDFVLEARLHIISSNYIPNIGTGTREGYYFIARDTTGRSYAIGLADDGFNINTTSKPDDALTQFAIASAFHTYRLEVHGGTASFLIDGITVESNIVPVLSAPDPTYSVLFGAGAGASLSASELKYLCFTSSAS